MDNFEIALVTLTARMFFVDFFYICRYNTDIVGHLLAPGAGEDVRGTPTLPEAI